MAQILNYPIRQSVAFSNTLFSLYNQAKDSQDSEIIFDLKRSKLLTPFGIIMLTSTVLECQKQGKKCKYIEPENQNLRRFIMECGFNDFFGLKSKAPKRDLIRTGRVQLIQPKGIDYYIIENLSDIIDFHMNISPGVKDSIKMSLQETMTNVVDHSGVVGYLVCAYTYPSKEQIRLCIADSGRGILQSLRSSPSYRYLSNDYMAIKEATENGVSCRKERAGLGLNHIKQFLKVNKGQMCIISGKGKVYWKFDQGKILKQKMKMPFNGTIVKLIINTNKDWRYFLSNEQDYLF